MPDDLFTRIAQGLRAYQRIKCLGKWVFKTHKQFPFCAVQNITPHIYFDFFNKLVTIDLRIFHPLFHSVIPGLPLRWEPIFTQDHFFVSPSNQDAFQWVMGMPWSFPHLWIFGPKGCGKTHLAKLWAKKHHAEWVRPDRLDAINRQSRCYIVDFDQLDPESAHQAHMYSFLVHVQEYNKTCLWISRHSSSLWQGSLADVTSRVRSLVNAEIKAPDDVLLAKVLEKTLRDIGWKMQPRLIDFLIRRMPRSFAGVSELTTLVQHYATHNGLGVAQLKTILRCIERDD